MGARDVVSAKVLVESLKMRLGEVIELAIAVHFAAWRPRPACGGSSGYRDLQRLGWTSHRYEPRARSRRKDGCLSARFSHALATSSLLL
eukprot:6381108-Pyramimonas_sp.AAC.1